IGHAHNFDISPAGEVVGRRARSAPEIQQPHPVLQLQKNVFGFVGTRKCDAGENARAVVRLLVAIRAEHVIICTLLVVVLEKVARLRCPLDQLALLELIQLVTDLARETVLSEGPRLVGALASLSEQSGSSAQRTAT